MLSISRISIKNFRQYRNVELKFSDSNGLLLFVGKNGMGKSNFLNAICWCLYGDLPFRAIDDDGFALLNEEAAKLNKFDEVRVEMEVEMDQRSFSFLRSQRETQAARFDVLVKKGQNWESVENPNVVVDNFLPKSIRKFFLFEGEKVQGIFDEKNYSKNLKDSVLKVSDVELLERAAAHLGKLSGDINKELRAAQPKIEEESKKVDELTASVDNGGKELVELEEANKRLVQSMKTMRARAAEFSKYKELHKREANLDELHSREQAALDATQTAIDDLIVGIAPFYYVQDALAGMAKKVDQDRKKGQIPAGVASVLIEDLLKMGECICGTNLGAGSKERKKLEKLLEQNEPIDKKASLLENAIFLINTILQNLKLLPDQLRTLRAKRAELEQSVLKISKELKDVKESLVNAPDKELGSIESTIQMEEEQERSNTKRIATLEFEILRSTRERKEYQEKITIALEKSAEHKGRSAQFEFINKANETIVAIREKLVDQVRRSVSFSTDKYFKELHWKKDEFDSIEFTDDYDVIVRKTNKDSNEFANLSTGELKVLAYATIKALTEISGFKSVPIFIDGPLEFIGEDIRSNLLKLLKGLDPDKQVFVFSLDHESVKDFGKANVKPSNFFELMRSRGSTSTSVLPYAK